MFEYKNKVAIITGASGIGIGNVIARRFFEAGAKVAICSRSSERIALAKREIGAAAPERIFAMAADARDVEEIQRFIKEAAEHFGRLDVLVNNAGVHFPKPSLDVTQEDWDATFSTNIRGYFFAAQAAARYMIDQGDGSIVNIGSVNGSIVTPGETAYAATKAAIEQMTRSLAREWGPAGIRVNCVAPGSIPTLMNQEQYADPAIDKAMCDKLPLGRRGRADEIADAVLYLASSNASYVTGQTLYVDGGLTIVRG